MRNTGLVFVSLVLLGCRCSFAADAVPIDPNNLLKNASFEIPMDADNWMCDQPGSWVRWGNWFNREIGWKINRSGEALVSYQHNRIKGWENAGMYQDVRDADKGKNYTFSLFAWVDKDANAENVQLQLNSYQSTSVLANAVFRLKKLNRDQWIPLSVTGTAANNGLRVTFLVEPKEKGLFPHGCIKFDDASLRLATEDESVGTNSK